jgi:hypothetical protein
MVYVFFVPGMFGTSIEYVLRSFTAEYKPIEANILPDGSMHSFKKEWHPYSMIDLSRFKNLSDNSIATPIYPFKDTHLPEILDKFTDILSTTNSVLIYANSARSAELNLLFQYYKIAKGLYNKGIDIFCGENSQNIINWNINYTHWSEMQTWELREWFSIFYPNWIREWVESHDQAPDNFLKIPNTDILFDTKNTLLKIINFCNLTYRPESNIDQFISNWQLKQQYIVDEFDLLDQILDHTLSATVFKWKDLNIISEAIIQQRLRSKGYEIRCDGLNTFPTDSITLYNLLEKC